MKKVKAFTEMSEAAKTVAISYGIPPENAPRYSMWRPENSSTSTIMETDVQGKTWFLTIHDDELGYVVAAFLEHHGAPVFSSAQKRRAYTGELERQLQSGLSPVAARDEALRMVDASLGDVITSEKQL